MTVPALLVLAAIRAGDAAPPLHPATLLPIRDVAIEDGFWSPKLEVWRTVTLPDSLAKFEKDGAIRNFDRVRDGLSGEHGGPPWYDGLIYETIRAAADFLAARPDPNLEARIDGYIERIAAAQARDPEGYINTYTQLVEPGHRFGRNGGNDNWQHDLYNAGALVEAGVHWFRATGKTSLLAVAARMTNHMCDVMGPPPRANVVPGHSIAEEAVVKLHLLFRERPELKKALPFPVDERRYLELVQFWLENRGNHEGRREFGSYAQDHLPLLRQPTAEGHAVRATLLYAGLAAAAGVNGREDYLRTALRLRDDLVERKTYITGGLGSTAEYEGFGPAWYLPNTGYLETCAAVGGMFFHRNLGLLLGDAASFDEVERALYNGVLSGVALKGDSYFYENPLESRGRSRWSWHGCPRCPPMFLKAVAGLPELAYASDERGLLVNLYLGSRARFEFGGTRWVVRQTTRYPWDGEVRLALEPETPAAMDLRLRVPGWCRGATVAVAGGAAEPVRTELGYVSIRRSWKQGEEVVLALPMPAERVRAHRRIEANRGKVALRRGPIVYCLEGADHPAGALALSLSPQAKLATEPRPGLLGGVVVVRGEAMASRPPADSRSPYPAVEASPPPEPVPFTAVPYFANSNRASGDLAVWIPESPGLSDPRKPASITSLARPSASRHGDKDSPEGLNDGEEPLRSDDEAVPRLTFLDHQGTVEWAQYDLDRSRRVAAVEVYFVDERRTDGPCRLPRSWRVLRREGTEWKPVAAASGFPIEADRFVRASFEPVETDGLRIEVQLEPARSGGILEWRVEEAPAVSTSAR